jgi:hypothetical protein
MNNRAGPQGGQRFTWMGDTAVLTESEIDRAIAALEAELPHLQTLHAGMFAFANAWAERYDAILGATPEELRAAVEHRLHRIGIRWGLAPGARMTTEFPAMGR